MAGRAWRGLLADGQVPLEGKGLSGLGQVSFRMVGVDGEDLQAPEAAGTRPVGAGPGPRPRGGSGTPGPRGGRRGRCLHRAGGPGRSTETTRRGGAAQTQTPAANRSANPFIPFSSAWRPLDLRRDAEGAQQIADEKKSEPVISRIPSPGCLSRRARLLEIEYVLAAAPGLAQGLGAGVAHVLALHQGDGPRLGGPAARPPSRGCPCPP